MEQSATRQKLQGMAQVLVMENLLNEQQALQYQVEAQQQNQSLVQYLVSNNHLDAKSIASVCANDFGVPLLDIACFDKELLVIDLISEKLIRRHNTLPLYHRGDHLFIAVDDPSRQIVINEIQFHTGLNTNVIVVESDKLSQLIDEILNNRESAALGEYLEDGQEFEGLEISAQDEEQSLEQAESTDDAPIVRFVHKILLDAIKRGASDIHFEPYERYYRVRFRQDGMLNEVATPPVTLASRITARIKVMSNLDISERRIPQDGRFKMKLSQRRSIDFRVSTCPTVNGEKVVMRILDPSATKLGIDALGFSERQKFHFQKCIQHPQGMILVTGPTGSGKTVTLYTALNILNTQDKNISTAEDPVEIKLTGVNQVNINPKTGLDFSSALRSFLRQDPDIIMVGEMRDLETAEIGVKAAQTGHLVLSTLHTNSASETLTRLVNMGVPPFNIAGSVSLIIAQRLARKLCDYCKEKYSAIPPETLIQEGFEESEIGTFSVFKAVGCSHCTNGYKGRTGFFEVLPISSSIGQIIMEGGNSLDILKQAQNEGMKTIRASGLDKVRKGITCIEEVNRVTKD